MPDNTIREDLGRLAAAARGSATAPSPFVGGSSAPAVTPDSGQRADLNAELAGLIRRVRDLEQAAAPAPQAAASPGGPRRVADAVSDVRNRTASLRPAGGSRFALAPLAAGIAKLFDRGGKQTEVELPQFRAPLPVRLDAGLTADGGLTGIDYGADGLPRVAGRPPQQTPVTINVQAMDSRSFLDHSGEIARAVREAMLNMHSLNDVVNDL
ncbi:MAG: hypothetical protein FJW39_03735 [Acidobacteria bacterium]|nr:hypothetical protein [Acidobacteriota bacterium]